MCVCSARDLSYLDNLITCTPPQETRNATFSNFLAASQAAHSSAMRNYSLCAHHRKCSESMRIYVHTFVLNIICALSYACNSDFKWAFWNGASSGRANGVRVSLADHRVADKSKFNIIDFASTGCVWYIGKYYILVTRECPSRARGSTRIYCIIQIYYIWQDFHAHRLNFIDCARGDAVLYTRNGGHVIYTTAWWR